jgi:hypothetical protein
VTTHSETLLSGSEELSLEEQAIQGVSISELPSGERKDFADEDDETAALAEGRVRPPADVG